MLIRSNAVTRQDTERSLIEITIYQRRSLHSPLNDMGSLFLYLKEINLLADGDYLDVLIFNLLPDNSLDIMNFVRYIFFLILLSRHYN